MRSRVLASVAIALTTAAAAPPGSSAAGLVKLLPAGVGDCLARPAAAPAPWSRESRYVAVEDGTRLAIDRYLPSDQAASERRPTIFMSTRYWRAREGDGIPAEFQPWIDAGYAVVIADVRGTGASFGRWYLHFTSQEARDIGFLTRWVARQPWSDGRVVTTGNSYPGTNSLMSPAFGAPAVRAIIPRFSGWDLFEDVGYPGGAKVVPLIGAWGQMVRGLDLNRKANGIGVRPVDGPDGAALLDAAVAEHAEVPGGVDQLITLVDARDDAPPPFGGHTMAELGVYRLRARIAASRVPIFGWGSWMDAGMAQGMLNRFVDLPNQQLSIIGPWIHGARADGDPFKPVDAVVEPSVAMQRRIDLCFAQRTLAGDPSVTAAGSKIYYYTMGEDRWKATGRWPVAGARPTRFSLAMDGGLQRRPPARAGEVAYRVDPTATTGPLNRWITQMGIGKAPDIDFGDRRAEDRKLLTFDTAPLARATELTGTPLVRLSVVTNATAGLFFAYLEDVAPDGRVTYITEGQLNGVYRRLARTGEHYKALYPARTFERKDRQPLEPGKPTLLEFQLQPTSVLIRAGHRIRLAIAGADKDSFEAVTGPDGRPPQFRVRVGGADGSSLLLPVVGAAAE